MQLSKSFLLVLLAGSFLLLASCTAGDYDCEGAIVIENEIPDTTLVLDGEPFRRDVFEEPVVFRHTAQKNISILVVEEDVSIVNASRRRNENTGKTSIIEVVANSVGTTTVDIIATDECPDYEEVTSFQVTVVDSSSSN